jgi:serine/threonine-protein kinase RsbW
MLMPMPQTPPLRCGPVSQTPTGDQLGDQRYGADSAAGGADLRELRYMSAGAEAVFGPVGAGGDLAANQHSCGCACPADQSASDLPRAAVCGSSVGHSAVDQWQAPMYAVSSLSGSLAVGHSRAVPNSAVCRDAQSDEERRLTERYRTEPLPASTLDVIVPATTQNATALRRTFRCWVGSLIADDVAEDLTLAVYEALTNVAEHAFTAHRAPGSIWLHAIVADGQITVTVTDNGRWRPPTDSGGHRGRGLPLIHQLTTEAQVAPSRTGRLCAYDVSSTPITTTS